MALKPTVLFPYVAFKTWPGEVNAKLTLDSVPLGCVTATVYEPAAGAVTWTDVVSPRFTYPGVALTY